MLDKTKIQRLKDFIRQVFIGKMGRSSYAELSRKVNYFTAGWAQRRAVKPLSYVRECHQPLVYISEPPRSGGTLLRSLFDGHPQLHVFPHELSFDKKGIFWRFDDLVDASCRVIFNRLRDDWTDHFFVNGIDRVYPFYFNRSIQRRIFQKLLPTDNELRTERAISDAYISSFFNAWIDYQGLYGSDKRYKVAFCPWPLSITEEDVLRFFDVYPDGYRIHVVRDPFSWWASYRKFHRGKQEGALPVEDHFSEMWLKNCRLARKLGGKMPDKYLVVLFDDLLRDPESVMRNLAEKIGVDFSPSMLEPALNSIPRKSNSTHSNGQFGFDTEVLNRWKSILPEEEVTKLKDLVGGEYSLLVEEVRRAMKKKPKLSL